MTVEEPKPDNILGEPKPDSKSLVQARIDVINRNFDLPENVTAKLDRIATAQLHEKKGELSYGTDVSIDIRLEPKLDGLEIPEGVSYSTAHLPLGSSVAGPHSETRISGTRSASGFAKEVIPDAGDSLKVKVNKKVEEGRIKEEKDKTKRFKLFSDPYKAPTPQDIWHKTALMSPPNVNYLAATNLLHTNGKTSSKETRGVDVVTITDATTVITHKLIIPPTNYGHQSLAQALKENGTDGFVAGQEVYDKTPEAVVQGISSKKYAPPEVKEQIVITTSDAELAGKLKRELNDAYTSRVKTTQ